MAEIQLTGEPAELRFTIEIKRKETGLVEVYDLVGHVVKEETPVQITENKE